MAAAWPWPTIVFIGPPEADEIGPDAFEGVGAAPGVGAGANLLEVDPNPVADFWPPVGVGGFGLLGSPPAFPVRALSRLDVLEEDGAPEGEEEGEFEPSWFAGPESEDFLDSDGICSVKGMSWVGCDLFISQIWNGFFQVF